jgi:hypothetical protein
MVNFKSQGRAFIQRIKARGLGNLSIEELVRLRDQGGDGE